MDFARPGMLGIGKPGYGKNRKLQSMNALERKKCAHEAAAILDLWSDKCGAEEEWSPQNQSGGYAQVRLDPISSPRNHIGIRDTKAREGNESAS